MAYLCSEILMSGLVTWGYNKNSSKLPGQALETWAQYGGAPQSSGTVRFPCCCRRGRYFRVVFGWMEGEILLPTEECSAHAQLPWSADASWPGITDTTILSNEGSWEVGSTRRPIRARDKVQEFRELVYTFSFAPCPEHVMSEMIYAVLRPLVGFKIGPRFLKPVFPFDSIAKDPSRER